jgi:predicted MPP superfamily phosphohydrolase
MDPNPVPTFELNPGPRGKWFQVFRPFDFEWNRAKLQVPNLPSSLRGLRIIHLTDFHLRGRWHAAFDGLIDRVRAADADLLLFTGDFVDNKRNHSKAMPTVYRLAEGLTARRGCFAILGNHDGPDFGPKLAATKFDWISGERRELIFGDAKVELIGLPGYLRIDLPRDFAATMPPPPGPGDNTLRIVLSHFPDHLPRTAALRPHLFLAGHTHGGQVCLPGRIPILKHDRMPRRFCSGINRIEETWLVVNRGFGVTTLPIRVFCPPEVLEIELI